MHKKIASWLVVILLTFTAARHFAGYHFFARYERREDAIARGTEPDSSRPERDLLAAVRFSGNPVFYGEMGRFHLKRVYGALEAGSAEGADEACDRAAEALKEQIRRNPADSGGWYQLGMVTMLFNYPAMTYRIAGRAYLKRAVELDPGNEFICANVVSIFVGQWEELGPNEKSLVASQFRRRREYPGLFLREIQRQVLANAGSDRNLRAALDLTPELREGYIKFLR
jgi:hypothetical protein